VEPTPLLAGGAVAPAFVDAVNVKYENGKYLMTLPMYSGNILKEVTFEGDKTLVVAVRSGACKKEVFEGASGEVTKEKEAEIAQKEAEKQAELERKEAEKQGIQVVAREGYSDGDKDFKAQLTKIAQQNPDVLFIPAYYEQDGLIAIQAREVGLKSIIVGSDGWDGVVKTVDSSSYAAIENVYFANHYSTKDSNERIQNFIKNYKEKYNDKRRTTIEEERMEILPEDLIKDEEIIITYTNKGYVKRIEASKYKAQRRGGKGVSALSSDLRDVEAARDTNPHAAEAIDVYINRIKQYVGAYAAAMNGVDAIVFTAGVGENATWVREEVLEGLTFLGVQVDKERNNVRGKVAEISTTDSKVKAFVIPTDEEVMIARDTYNLSK